MSLSLKKLLLITALTACALSACPDEAGAYTLKSRYFTLSADDSVDKLALIEKLKAKYLRHLETIYSAGGGDPDELLKSVLDAVYLEVSDALDIHMYSFNIALDIVRDRAALRLIAEEELKRPLDLPSLYIYDKNKIYISFPDMTLGMLSHEVAHAIVSHYFVVPPPAKVQEILSGYAEYSVRKISGDPPAGNSQK